MPLCLETPVPQGMGYWTQGHWRLFLLVLLTLREFFVGFIIAKFTTNVIIG
jgi:hypothetical protein